MNYGEIVTGVDLDRLLVAIAAVETAGGENVWPRLEPAYLPPGRHVTAQGRIVTGTGLYFNDVMRALWAALPPGERLGASASWGPWQILYPTAVENGYSGRPSDLHLASFSEPPVVARLRRLAARGAASVRDFADGWNSGSFRDSNLVHDYTSAVEAAYGAAPAAS